MADDYIESGITLGRQYVHNYVINCVPKIERQRDYVSSQLDWKSLQEQLCKNNYLVSVTDKNLGVAVITKQWFIEGCLSLLSDQSNYRLLSPEDSANMLRRTIGGVKELADLADRCALGSQLVKFLVHKCPLNDDELPVLPRFYVIPKIHKKPVKYRPIVPCHSTVQAPLAKFVSKLLKPIVEKCRYVLKGTKQLAQKLAELKLDPSRKAWIVSGDVVAFYPSIPLDDAIEIVYDMYIKFYPDSSEEMRDLVLKSLVLVNAINVVEFQGLHYLQTAGLAMGQAPSPDIANLWGAHFEEKLFETHVEWANRWAFFGRYIDDCLGIVYAETADQARRYAELLRLDLPGQRRVRIEWEVSEWSTPFLDMRVYIDPASKRVEHSAYQKKLNHKERIPWASHHPKDVKKGTFIGEMARLATLSSKLDAYLDALHDLKSLYMGRGYPEKLVNNWLKDHCAERWDRRLRNPAEARPVLVLKTEFNPAWYDFNVNELGKTICSSWAGHLRSEYDRMLRAEQLADQASTRNTGNTLSGETWQLMPDGSGQLVSRYPVRVNPPPTALPGGSGAEGAGQSGSNDGRPRVLGAAGQAEIVGSRWRDLAPSDQPSEWMSRTILFEEGRVKEEVFFDVARAGLLDRQWLVSRKRTRNLFDATQAWKQSVLSEINEDTHSANSEEEYWSQLWDIDVTEV
jgi:hypothetical protein